MMNKENDGERRAIMRAAAEGGVMFPVIRARLRSVRAQS